jgi:hypothetical protein
LHGRGRGRERLTGHEKLGIRVDINVKLYTFSSSKSIDIIEESFVLWSVSSSETWAMLA